MSEQPASLASAATTPAPEVAAPQLAAEPQETTPPREPLLQAGPAPEPAAAQPPPLPQRRPTQQRAEPSDADPAEEAQEAPRRPVKPVRRADTPAQPPSAASAGSAARAAASRGALIAYRSRVQAHVASRRPAGIGASGRVVIGFGLSPTGGLAYAAVAQSSGNAALDRLALASVRAAAPFPPPPAGSRTGELRFAFPYTFR